VTTPLDGTTTSHLTAWKFGRFPVGRPKRVTCGDQPR
jgi:hypothetical protein